MSVVSFGSAVGYSRADYPELSDVVSLIGPLRSADLTGRIASEITLHRTIDGATTLTFAVSDHDRALMRSGILGDADGNLLRSFTVVGGYHFELAAVSKRGDLIEFTFEDAIVSALKRQRTPRVWPARSATRQEIAASIAAEAGVPIVCDPAARDVVIAAVTRNEKRGSANPSSAAGGAGGPEFMPILNDDGTPFVPTQADDGVGGQTRKAKGGKHVANPVGMETGWSVVGKLATDARMRCYSDGTRLYFGTDYWLADRIPAVTLVEGSESVHNIDYSCDVGLPDAAATVTLDAGAWSFRAGDPVTVPNMGPASGGWLIKEWSEDLGRVHGTLTLTREQQAWTEAQIHPQGSGDSGDVNFTPDGATPGVYTDGPSAMLPGPDGTVPGVSGVTGRRATFLAFALAQRNKPYVYGATGPNAWDCSGLTQAAAAAAGRPLPRTAQDQLAACQQAGTTIPVQTAMRTKGALLFRVNYPGLGPHVAISLGDGSTMEARGAAYGVGIFGGTFSSRSWTDGALWV